MINTLKEKTFLYVDDQLLYLADSARSLSTALQVISHFGDFSVFPVSWNKSNVMPFSLLVFPPDNSAASGVSVSAPWH